MRRAGEEGVWRGSKRKREEEEGEAEGGRKGERDGGKRKGEEERGCRSHIVGGGGERTR